MTLKLQEVAKFGMLFRAMQTLKFMFVYNNNKDMPFCIVSIVHFKVMLPSPCTCINHGKSAIWGGLNHQDNFKALETLHCRAARIKYTIPLEICLLMMS